MPDLVVHVAAAVYAVLGAVLAVPQLVRVVRTRQVAGLSLPGWVNGCLSYGAWGVYLASEAAWPLFWGTVTAAAPWAAVTLAVAVARQKSSLRAWVPVMVWGLVLMGTLGISLAGSKETFAAVLASSAVWAYGPSLVHAWKSPDVSGLSPLTWGLGVAEGIASSVAGWGLWPAMTYGMTAAVLCLGVMVRIWLAASSRHLVPGQ